MKAVGTNDYNGRPGMNPGTLMWIRKSAACSLVRRDAATQRDVANFSTYDWLDEGDVVVVLGVPCFPGNHNEEMCWTIVLSRLGVRAVATVHLSDKERPT